MRREWLEVTPEREQARREFREAESYFISGVAKIVGDMRELRPGADGFDYFIPVPASKLHDWGMAISALELDVQDRFGIKLSLLPIPHAG